MAMYCMLGRCTIWLGYVMSFICCLYLMSPSVRTMDISVGYQGIIRIYPPPPNSLFNITLNSCVCLVPGLMCVRSPLPSVCMIGPRLLCVWSPLPSVCMTGPGLRSPLPRMCMTGVRAVYWAVWHMACHLLYIILVEFYNVCP